MRSRTVSTCKIARMKLVALAKIARSRRRTRFVTLLDVAGIDREDARPRHAAFPRARLRRSVPDSDLRRRRSPVRQAAETYNRAFNLLTEKAVNVRSEARDAFRVYRSTYDIAEHYQRELRRSLPCLDRSANTSTACATALHLVRDESCAAAHFALVMFGDVIGRAIDPECIACFRADVHCLLS